MAVAALVLVALVIACLVGALLIGLIGTTALLGLCFLIAWAARVAVRAARAWRARPVDEGHTHVTPATFTPRSSYVV